MATHLVVAIVALLLTGAAHATTITEIVIRGQGVVTLSIPGTVDDNVITPEVGSTVEITGKVFFGGGVAPSDANGEFICCGEESISKVEIGLSGLGTIFATDEYNGSRVTLMNGRVSDFFLGDPYFGGDPGGYISDTNLDFEFENGIAPICDASGYCLTSSLVLGAWTVSSIEVLTDAVPEPTQWMLMLVGFALAGSRLRHREVVPY